jgi:hypothetical protein
MSDVATITEEQVQTQAPSGRQEITVDSNALAGNMWGVEVPKTEPAAAPVVEQPKVEQPKVEEAKVEPTPEPTKTWINDFGWENEETAKAEIKKLKEQTTQEVKFENEESKKLAQAIAKGDRKKVLEILETQERLESLSAAEVNDETAEQILKMSLQLKHKEAGLSQAEIDYKYNKEFGFPKEPLQRDDELEEEFDARKAEWQEKVNDIKMNRRMEAKLAKPELDKLKSQIVLPDISQSSEQKPPTQEELDNAKKYDEGYIQSVDNSLKTFDGVTVAVKNEVVDFPVTFGVTDEDKTMLSTLMKDFQKGNYDANGLFADLWVNEDKTLKTNEMIEDYYLIKNKKALFSKIANDSANKAIESYIKGKKKINVDETSNPGTTILSKEDKTELDEVRDSFFG